MAKKEKVKFLGKTYVKSGNHYIGSEKSDATPKRNVDIQEVKKPFYKKWWFWLIICFFIIGFLSNLSEQPESSKQITPQIHYLDMSFSEVKDAIDQSEYTDLKKDQIFNDRFKGRYVKWEGVVSNIDTAILDDLKMVVTLRKAEGLLESDNSAYVYLDNNQYNNLIRLNKDDKVIFSGKLKSYSYGFFGGFSLTFEDGAIINKGEIETIEKVTGENGVECINNSDCGDGNVCINNKCLIEIKKKVIGEDGIECLKDYDCINDREDNLCNISNNKCVQCLNDIDCKDDEYPYCLLSKNKCVQCLNHSDCKDRELHFCHQSNNYCGYNFTEIKEDFDELVDSALDSLGNTIS